MMSLCLLSVTCRFHDVSAIRSARFRSTTRLPRTFSKFVPQVAANEQISRALHLSRISSAISPGVPKTSEKSPRPAELSVCFSGSGKTFRFLSTCDPVCIKQRGYQTRGNCRKRPKTRLTTLSSFPLVYG